MPLLLQSITPFVTWSSALTILICQIDPRIFCLLMFIGTMWFDVICIMCIHLSHVCPFWIQCFKLQTRCDCHGHDALWLWSARCDRCRTWWISLRIMRSMHPDARSCTWIATNIDKSMTSPWWKDVESLWKSDKVCQTAILTPGELRSILVQLLALAIDHLIVKVKPAASTGSKPTFWSPFSFGLLDIIQLCNRWRIFSFSSNGKSDTCLCRSLQSVKASLQNLHRIEPSIAFNVSKTWFENNGVFYPTDINRSQHSKGQYSTKAGHIHVLPNAVRVILTAENMQWLCSCRTTPNNTK